MLGGKKQVNSTFLSVYVQSLGGGSAAAVALHVSFEHTRGGIGLKKLS